MTYFIVDIIIVFWYNLYDLKTWSSLYIYLHNFQGLWFCLRITGF